MQATSFIFVGLLLVPLAIFIAWLIKQDKKRNKLGLILLIIGSVIALYTIIRLDASFVKEKIPTAAPKPSSFR